MFIIRNNSGKLMFSTLSTPSVVTRCKLLKKDSTATVPYMLLQSHDGRKYIVNTSNSTAKII